MNPCIELKVEDRWDALGLPVSSAVIRSFEDTLGTSAAPTIPFVIDSTSIRFANPEWDELVKRTATVMFPALGLVGSDTSNIGIDLKTLYICPAGSHL